jgi:beta-galactosidase
MSALAALCLSCGTFASGPPETARSKTLIVGPWKFVPGDALVGAEAPAYDDRSWQTVTTPHTWDTAGEVAPHSNSWYRTHVNVPATAVAESVYAYFEGVFQVADVYWNGTWLGQHRGGYTRFAFDATRSVRFGADNVLAVKVDSSPCADCLPDGTPKFLGYGGIYRKVWLIRTSRYHVAVTDFASSGVYITPAQVSRDSADVSVHVAVTNDSGEPTTLQVQDVFEAADGRTVMTLSGTVRIGAHTTTATIQRGLIAKPRLWDRADPYLYTVRCTVRRNGRVTDSVVEHTGFRSYRLTETDFVLNGVSTRLRGVAKHQETEYHASAVTDEELIEDWDALNDLGVNFVRLVHYPHADLEYSLADRMGIMVWCENGNVGRGGATPNGQRITQEMVYQNWNHPSVIFWSAGNEANSEAASSYGRVIRAADVTRPVVYADMQLFNAFVGKLSGLFSKSDARRLDNIDFVFSNPYPGWYYGSIYDFPSVVASTPWISEAGVGGVITSHGSDYFSERHSVNWHEPEEYMQLCHEVMYQTVFATEPAATPAFVVWCARDFAEKRYKRRVNTKGLRTYSNFPKDVAYLYKSFLTSSPVLHIVGAHYFLRSGSTAIKAYSNAPYLDLIVNGKPASRRSNGNYTHPNGLRTNNVFYWDGALKSQRNEVIVSDGRGGRDSAVIYLTKAAMSGERAAPLVTNLISTNPKNPAYFIDIPAHDQWGFYYDFDGNGDNSFDVVPKPAAGAGWIATRRQSDPSLATTISFSLTKDADVYVMFGKQAPLPSWLADGFHDTGVSGKWRDNYLRLVGYRLFQRTCRAGESLKLGGAPVDFVTLVKPISAK